jgi:hypothetical protein
MVNKPMNELEIRTLLHQSGIEIEKGFPTVTLLFALIVLPVIKQSLSFFFLLFNRVSFSALFQPNQSTRLPSSGRDISEYQSGAI